ncbi:MAG: hypothetical protein AB1430_24810 [Pseudomonadota bacterium]
MNRIATRPAPRARLLAAALVAAFSGSVYAETSPWYVGARQTFTHDSNVYRRQAAESDLISSTGLFGGLDQQISRQRLRGNVAANINRYRDADQLDHTDGSAGLRLDWETVGNLSGDAQVNHQRSLFRDFALQADASRKAIVRTTDAAFNARLGVVTALTLEAGAFGSRTRYDELLRNSNLDYDGYRAGVRWADSPAFSVGLAYRNASGEYPNTNGVGDFDREDADLLLTWAPTGTSTFVGRVSRTQLDFPNIGDRSDTLTTGALQYLWRPGGRVTLDLSVDRDSSAGRAVTDGVVQVLPGLGMPGTTQSADARVVTTTGLSAGYELTGKIKLGLDLRHAERDLDNAVEVFNQGGQPVPGLSVQRHASDRTYSAGLNATYDATRSLRFTCGFTRVKRTVSGPDWPVLTYPYTVNLTSCAAQFALQP